MPQMLGDAGQSGPTEVRCGVGMLPGRPQWRACARACPSAEEAIEGGFVGSVIKKRRKRMAKKKHRKLLRKTRVQRRNKK
jgi:Mitochondrial domain of unknown function (DUF1713)